MFVEPDFRAPIDFEARLAAVPADAQVRGMFLQLLVQSLGESQKARLVGRRYVAFKNYPMRDYVELLALSCADQADKVAPAEQVRRLGRLVYPSYAESLTGTAIFAAAGHNFRRVVELCPAAYRVAATPGSLHVRSISNGSALVELRDLWNLPDFHQIGIWEGAMQVCNARGKIRVQVHSFSDVDFEVSWTDSTSLRARSMRPPAKP